MVKSSFSVATAALLKGRQQQQQQQNVQQTGNCEQTRKGKWKQINLDHTKAKCILTCYVVAAGRLSPSMVDRNGETVQIVKCINPSGILQE